MGEIESALLPEAPRLAVAFSGEGELVVMLHGVGGNRRNWYGQIAALAPHYRAVAWDARGYGDSEDYAGDFVFEEVSADLCRVLDYFGSSRAHLIGLSMGGNIALDFAIRWPERTASLVLANTDRGMQHIPSPERDDFVRLRAAPILTGVALKDLAGPIVDSLLGPQASSACRAEMIDSILRLHRESYLKAVMATVEFDMVGKLGEIAAPTLVIVGSEDRLTPVREAVGLSSEIAGSEIAIIDGAGHLSNLEKPEQFNQTVLAFLERVSAAGGIGP